MNKLSQEAVIIFLGIVTTLLVTALLVFADIRFNHALYTFSLWVVFPIGAIGAGFLSGSGYYLGARLFNRKPGKMVLVSMLVSAFATYFLVHYFTYYFLKAEGSWLREHMGFAEYIRGTVENSGLSIYHNGVKTNSSYTLGFWGYLFQLIYVAGFYLGGMLIYGKLQSMIYCDKCSQYFSFKGKRVLYSSDPKKIEEITKEISALIAQKEFRQAVQRQSGIGLPKFVRDDCFKSVIIHRQCKTCCQNHLKINFFRRAGPTDWKEIEGTDAQFQTNDPIEFL